MPCKGLNWGTSNPQWVSVPTHPRRMAEIITNASVKQNQNKQTQTLKVKWKCACELAQEDIPGPGSGTLMTSPSCKLRPGSVLLVALEKEAGISGIFLRIDHHMKARTVNSLPITTQRFGLMSRFTKPLKSNAGRGHHDVTEGRARYPGLHHPGKSWYFPLLHIPPHCH